MFLQNDSVQGVDDNGDLLLEEGEPVVCLAAGMYLDRFFPQGAYTSEALPVEGEDLPAWEGPFPSNVLAVMTPSNVFVCQTGEASGSSLGVLLRYQLSCPSSAFDPPIPGGSALDLLPGTVVAMRESAVHVFDFCDDLTFVFTLAGSANPLQLDL